MSDLVVTLRLSGNADGAVTAVRLVKRETDGLGDSTERAARRGVNAFDGMTGSLKGFAKQAAASALAAVGIGTAAAVIGAAIGNARDFGQAMAEVSTVAADTSKMAGMTQAVRDLAKEYGQAPTSQAKALYEIISAGISDTARATETLEASNRLALGGITEVETAADGLTTVLNSYGAAAGSAAEVSDRLFVAALAGKTTIGELSASIGNAAPIAAQTGVSLDELLASVAALTLGGVKTTTAVDGVRATIAAIIKPSKEATEMAAGLGLQFDAAALKSQGFAGFLENVQAATGGSAEKLAVLFGGVEALAPVMALTGNQAEAFAATIDSMADSAGVTDEAVAKMANTAQFQFARLKAEVSDSLLSIGQSMLTVLAPAAGTLADNWDTLADTATDLATALAVLAGATAIGAVITSLKTLYTVAAAGAAWQALGIGVSGAASALKAAALAGDAFGARLVALAGGPVVVAATALGLLAIEVKKNWDLITEAEQRGARSIAMAQGSIGTGLAGRGRPLAAIETDVERLADLMQRDRGREQVLERHRTSLAALQAQYLKAGGSVEKWNTLLDKSAGEARSASEASTEQGAALATLNKIAAEAGLTSTKLAEENKKHAAALRALAIEEAKGGEAAKLAASIRAELNKQHAETVAQLTGATEATKANEKATREAAEADDDRAQALRRLIEQQQRAADEEYAGALINSEDAAISAGRMVDALRAETAQAGLTRIELQHLAETRQFDALMRDAQLARSPEQQAALRAEFNLAQEARTAALETAAAAQFAAQESQRAWEDLATGMADAVLDGSDGVKRYWKQLIDDLKRQLLSSGLMSIFGQIFNTGGAQTGNSLLGQLFSGGANSGGAAAQGAGGLNIGSLLGSVGGLLGGTSSAFGTGLLASSSIFSGAGLIGGLTGSISAGVSSILGGSIMQGVGLLAGPVGLIVGAVSLLASVIKKDKPPDFRVGGTGARVRGVEGNFDTVFGQVNAGSRQISWESLVGPMQQFDEGIQNLVNTMGGGQPQIDAITTALSTWVVDLRGSAATAENVLGSRFRAVLGTFSTDVQAFVGTTGTVQEQVARLTDALSIEKIVDTGALGESFADVSALLTEYRVGTEAIADTYARVLGSVTLLDEALAISGTTLDMTRGEMIRWSADIATAAGGMDRLQSMLSSYVQTFYSEAERADYARNQAQTRAASQAGDIGLNLSDFTGTGGMQAFRELFESQIPTLTADAYVQWLEFADALATFVGLSSEATDAVASVSTSLTDLMASVTEQLEQYAPPQTFAQRLQAINVETDTMIAQARALGATEEQLGQIRALSAARLGEVLDEQAAAMADYQSMVQGLYDELADARGLSEFGREMREVNRWLADTTAGLNAAARAAGLQGAAESDLAAAHEIAAIRAAAAIARLEERGRSVVQELYGTPLERLNEQIAEFEAGISGFSGGFSSGMEQVTQATDNAVQAQLGAQQRIRDWLDNLMIGDLGGLRPKDALVEAQTLFDRTLQAALGGDADAMGQLPQLADQLLRLGQRVYASGDPYFDLRDAIRDALAQVAGIVTENPLPVGGGGGGFIGNDQGGFGGNGGGAGDLYAERDRLMAEQAAAERRALATELAGVIRDLMSDPERALGDIETTLGFSMADLVTDLGVNLDLLTVATASQLADIAQATGSELSDLAASVGVDLGSLAERQSLLNDALEADIAALPEGQRAALESLLRDVEEAAALGDTAGVERGIGDMEDAIGDMSEDIRDALAPYFIGIRPIDPVTELGHLSSMDTILSDSRGELQAQTLLLGNIYDVLNEPAAPSPPDGPLVPGGGFPGYAVGTSYVPADGLAYLHRGEAVFPASVSEWFRREGIPIRPMPVLGGGSGGQSGAGNDALLAELREMSRKLDEGNADRRRMEQRIQQLETTTARGDDAKVRAVERQTDAIKARR